MVSSFTDIYDLGKEVMPSTHSYMKVKFAKRKEDGLEAVVKVRFKPNCFRSREDERSWRHNTEFLLNLPDNSGVARLHEVLEDPKAFYVVMERIGGMDLFETLEAEGRVPVHRARDVVRHILASLVHLHSNNAVHKDLKLENIMLEHSVRTRRPTPESVKVIDFDTLEEWTPNMSTSKDVVGTDQYIAQEAYVGRYSPLSDIFAVGVIAYRLLTGRFPYSSGMFDDEPGENWVGSPKMAQIRRRLKIARVDFSHHVFKEAPLASDLVIRMLAHQEQHRPSAAAALEHEWFREALAELETRAAILRKHKSDGSGSTEDDPELSAWVAPARCQHEDLIDDGIIIAEECPLLQW